MVFRRWAVVAFVILVLSGLACSLGGAGTSVPEPTATEVVEQVPTRMPPTPGIAPTLISTQAPPTPIPPTETPTGTGPGGCILSEQFIADVTIPDGSTLAPGTPFVKTWRVKNNGTCNWENYQLIFAAGNQLSGPASVVVNNTPPGATVDVTVNLVAPATPGEYKGGWRFQATNAAIFGSLTVIINVPVPPTATPTATAAPASTNWSGEWITDCGSFNCGTVILVQNGTAINGTFSGGGIIFGTMIDNRLTGTWSRGGSSGSLDWWMGGSGVKWRGNYNAVNGWCGYRAGETEPAPCGVGTFTGNWNTVGESFNAPLNIYQDGSKLVGTLTLSSGNVQMNGSIDGVKASGTWNQPGGASSTFTWYLINAVQFNGNYNGDKKWCGYRTGADAPAQCFKP